MIIIKCSVFSQNESCKDLCLCVSAVDALCDARHMFVQPTAKWLHVLVICLSTHKVLIYVCIYFTSKHLTSMWPLIKSQNVLKTPAGGRQMSLSCWCFWPWLAQKPVIHYTWSNWKNFKISFHAVSLLSHLWCAHLSSHCHTLLALLDKPYIIKKQCQQWVDPTCIQADPPWAPRVILPQQFHLCSSLLKEKAFTVALMQNDSLLSVKCDIKFFNYYWCINI